MIEELKELRNSQAKLDGYLIQHLLHILVSLHGEPMVKLTLSQQLEA